jgi:hypothetical protein
MLGNSLFGIPINLFLLIMALIVIYLTVNGLKIKGSYSEILIFVALIILTYVPSNVGYLIVMVILFFLFLNKNKKLVLTATIFSIFFVLTQIVNYIFDHVLFVVKL